ncbi:peroxiredoxin [Rubritalea marina]|uniref:peroxiredoxin n=1 Tax=Rubritalea marina TaxID=361055 RepID=UPI00039BB878|nr:peroxiredoxin [Rubritalea marina]
MKLETGMTAPAFELPVVGGEYEEPSTVSLEDLRGVRVVLVFYPKDNTPGCTTQACDIRDSYSRLPQDVKVFGVSADSIRKHQNFITKQGLVHPLLSDESTEMLEAYGVWVEKKNFGKTYMGIVRTTVVIGAEGKIEAVMEKVKPATHLDDLLEILEV